MATPGIHAVQLIMLLLLVFVVAFSTLALKLKTPYPIVLVVAGLLLGLVPGIPKVALDPELVFLVVLPPLLYSAAWVTSWRDFLENLTSIASLAIGLVAFTVLSVAAAASWLSERKGYGERVGLTFGLFLSALGLLIVLVLPGRPGSKLRVDGWLPRRRRT